jgi:hypothetical protein
MGKEKAEKAAKPAAKKASSMKLTKLEVIQLKRLHGDSIGGKIAASVGIE